MARLLADENFPLPGVEELRRLGHDVLTIDDVGQAGQSLPDNAVLHLATTDERVLVTLNRKHFIRLHASTPQHAGIVVCTLDLDFVGQAKRIDVAIPATTSLPLAVAKCGGDAVTSRSSSPIEKRTDELAN